VLAPAVDLFLNSHQQFFQWVVFALYHNHNCITIGTPT